MLHFEFFGRRSHKLNTSKILIVDDDESILLVVKKIIEQAGYEAYAFTAPSAMRSRNVRPDLVLLDIRLAGLDGRDVCRGFKSDPLTAHIPVILISTSPSLAQDAKEAGADGFIEKPFDIRHLMNAVAFQLNKAREVTRGQSSASQIQLSCGL